MRDQGVNLYSCEQTIYVSERLLNGNAQMKHILVARCVNDQTDPVELSKTTEKVVKAASSKWIIQTR